MNTHRSLLKSASGLAPLWRQLQFALALTTLIPLLALSYLVLRYVEPAILNRWYVISLFFIIMVIMLTGTRMIFRMLADALGLTGKGQGGVAVPSGREIPADIRGERRSIRQIVANASALMGIIPLLVLGYVVVRYVMPVETVESILLLTAIVAVVLLLGMAQIYQLTNRMITIAGEARRVRMERGVARPDLAPDELGLLSRELSKISDKLSRRASELERSRAFFSRLVERLPNPLLAINPSGTINHANPAAAELLGYGPEELHGKNISELFPEVENVEELLEMSAGSVQEAVWRSKSGIHIPVFLCSAALSEKDSDQGSVLIGTDLTERKRAEEKIKASAEAEKKRAAELDKAYEKLRNTQMMLIQAEKMSVIGQLASGVAHELQNPLAIILLNINRLEKELNLDNETQSRSLNRIKEAVTRSDRIVRLLLDFSRPAPLDQEPCDLNKIIETSLELVDTHLSLKNIKIARDYSAKPAFAMLDENQMKQVIINIILNSLQAMPEGGVITIRTYRKILTEHKNGAGKRATDVFKSGEKVLICEVEDTGHGVPEDMLDKIFEPFFTTRSQEKGVGLGLAITRSIIERHRGHIRVESKEGQGTKVVIALPPIPDQ